MPRVCTRLHEHMLTIGLRDSAGRLLTPAECKARLTCIALGKPADVKHGEAAKYWWLKCDIRAICVFADNLRVQGALPRLIKHLCPAKMHVPTSDRSIVRAVRNITNRGASWSEWDYGFLFKKPKSKEVPLVLSVANPLPLQPDAVQPMNAPNGRLLPPPSSPLLPLIAADQPAPPVGSVVASAAQLPAPEGSAVRAPQPPASVAASASPAPFSPSRASRPYHCPGLGWHAGHNPDSCPVLLRYYSVGFFLRCGRSMCVFLCHSLYIVYVFVGDTHLASGRKQNARMVG